MGRSATGKKERNKSGNYLQGRPKRGKEKEWKEGQKESYINGIINKGKKDLNDKRQKEEK